jgi:hypothetical protein
MMLGHDWQIMMQKEAVKRKQDRLSGAQGTVARFSVAGSSARTQLSNVNDRSMLVKLINVVVNFHVKPTLQRARDRENRRCRPCDSIPIGCGYQPLLGSMLVLVSCLVLVGGIVMGLRSGFLFLTTYLF